MKFSRNPVTGQIEIYTDEGVFAGIMSTMGDNFAEKTEDGGPGSGNYGHKGRPGKRGGSGPGGGKQYRGGRSDIGYFSSRKDWLNGLSGEKQHTAVRAIAKAKAEYNSKLAAKQKIESLANRGLLTFPEAEERIKEGELDKIREGMPPEEYVLTNGTVKDRVDLMKHLKEARSWDETKDRMIAENLSEAEKRVLNAFENNKEGVEAIMLGPAEMADQAAQIKDLLEAKAMGVIESDIEIPDDLQYSLGTKEKPKPKRAIPKTQEENAQWLDSFPPEEQKRIEDLLKDARIDMYDFASQRNMTIAERRLMMDVWSNKADSMVTAELYLKAKDQMLEAGYYQQLQDAADPNSTSVVGNLGDKPSIILSQFMASLADEENERYGTKNSVGQIGDILESSFLRDKEVPHAPKAAYLQLKAMALGEDTRITDPETLAKGLHKYMVERKAQRQEEKEYGPKRERFRQDRETRKKAYSDATSSKQVGEEMRKSGMFRSGSGVSLSRTDLKSAQEAALAYESVLDRYPFLIGKLGGIDESETGSSNTYASCSMRTGGSIHLNAKDEYFGNFNKLLASYQSDVSTGYHPAGTNGTSIVTHEIGHALDGFLSQKAVLGARLFSTDANAFSGILRRRVLKALKLTKSSVRQELSQYATKNAYEWFAECFAEGMTSENPRPMAKECMRQLNEILTEEGLINA